MTPRILIVTDDGNLQALLGQAMTGSGLEIMLSTSGADGLRRWQTDAPALVLIDVNIGGLDGIALTDRIRARRRPAHAWASSRSVARTRG